MAGSLWRGLTVLYFLLCTALPAFATVSIRGVQAGVDQRTGQRPARQNLATWEFSGPGFDLYIQALRAFQYSDQKDIRSHFSIASVHGLPYGPWDGGMQSSRQQGYCLHDSTLFPLWHRPYLAIHERIAATYPANVRAKYVAAAKTLRIPYWDWASNPDIPRSMSSAKININTPTGMQSVDSPLYQYKFDPSVQKGFPAGDSFTSLSHSTRYPDSRGESQNNRAIRAMRSNGASLRSSVYQLLSGEKDYSTFSTQALPNKEGYNNVETVHGYVHSLVGGEGHMTYIPWSAYDPIFWLHHANVDRLIALWQAINPDSYVKPVPNRGGGYVTQPGTIEDGNSPLYPFHANDNTYYTANSARYTRTFGYTYPEIEDWGVSKQQLQANVRRNVNALYNPTNRVDSSNNVAKRASRHSHAHRSEGYGEGENYSHGHTTPDVDNILDNAFNMIDAIGDSIGKSLEKFDEWGINNMKKQWVIKIRVNKAAVARPFSIHFFMGDAPKDSSTWRYAPNLVGSYGTFVHGMGMADPSIVCGEIPLSPALAALLSTSTILGLDEHIVVPVLTKFLTWKIQDQAGAVIPTEDVAKSNGGHGLEIRVAKRDVKPLAKGDLDNFPTYGEWKTYESCTKGKAGGY
ncbi:tyrosinase [Arthroderma uncinatum]|uniref:tyrosinase n=1 Tax=Arthroderma uncinatum TaxID=74035 RepID=UPI00144AA04F|nr:tyrosinase [Arthroderma uncinatum]KAF3481610.1 tyrosinase [Arthroderma uncinatum]